MHNEESDVKQWRIAFAFPCREHGDIFVLSIAVPIKKLVTSDNDRLQQRRYGVNFTDTGR